MVINGNKIQLLLWDVYLVVYLATSLMIVTMIHIDSYVSSLCYGKIRVFESPFSRLVVYLGYGQDV